jgi:hypothetical protein
LNPRPLRPEPRHAAPAVADGCRVVHGRGPQHRRRPGLGDGLAAFLLPNAGVGAVRSSLPCQSIPSAVGPHASGAGFWPPVKVERPTGRTTLAGGQVPARLRPGRRQTGWTGSPTTHPPSDSRSQFSIPEPEVPAGGTLLTPRSVGSAPPTGGVWIGAFVVPELWTHPTVNSDPGTCRCGGVAVTHCCQLGRLCGRRGRRSDPPPGHPPRPLTQLIRRPPCPGALCSFQRPGAGVPPTGGTPADRLARRYGQSDSVPSQ